MSTFSEIKITFTQDLPIGAQLGFDINNDGGLWGVPTSVAQVYNWVNLRSSNHQVTQGTPTGIVGERSAMNFVIAWNLDVSGYTVTRTGNQVTIRVDNTYGITEFYVNGIFATYNNHPSLVFDIHNSTTAFRFDSVVLSAAPTPCTHVRITAQTNVTADSVISPVSIPANTANPIVVDVVRGADVTLEVHSNTEGNISDIIAIPSNLNPSNFTIAVLNTPIGAIITVSNSNTFGLNIEYSLDGITWQYLNSFSGIADGNSILYVRDNFGCSFQKAFTVNSSAVYNPSFYISKSNALRFAKRVDFNTTYKNDENTLSCEVDVRLPKKETQLFQSNDIIKGQFKSNYTANIVKVVKEDLTEINIPVIQKTNNIGQKDKRDAIIKSGGFSKIHVYFTAGNTYDYTTNIINGTYALNGSVPDWAVAGNFINVLGTWHLIEDVIFDETLNAEVIVFNGFYLGGTTPTIVSCLFNAENYEVYEFSIDMANYLNECIRVRITSSHVGFPDLVHLTESICVKLKQTNTIDIKYRNSTNTDIFYSTGIEFQIRQKIIFQNGINDQASEKYKTDTNVVLLSSDIYEGDEFVFEPVTKELMRKIIAALSHDIIFIDDVGYVKSESIEVEGPLNDTNWYAIKAKMLKNGDNYQYPPIVPPIIVPNLLKITNVINTSGSNYDIGFTSNFVLTNLFSEVSTDGINWSVPLNLLGIVSPQNIIISGGGSFFVRLSDVNSGVTTYSNIYNYIVAPIVCVIPTLISVTKTIGNILADYVWSVNGFDYSNGTVVMQYSIDNGVTWQQAGTSLSSLQSGNGAINGVALGTPIKYRIICNGNGCDNQISNVIDAIFDDVVNTLSANLTRVGNSLKLTISGGTAPYDYEFTGNTNGACGDFNITNPTGTTTNLVVNTPFTYQNGYSGISYDFSVNVTDSIGNSIVSNVISFGGCLIYGTKIITNSGEKNIEDIKLGGLILDKNNTFTKVTSYRVSIVDKVIDINNGLLVSSNWHIHLVKLNDIIIEKQAEQLVVGDKLIDRNGNEILIDSLVTIFENTPVINISTESKTYIANGILTHNKLQCPN